MRNLTRFRVMIGVVLLSILLLVGNGCIGGGQFRDNGLPAKRYLVGGGFDIEWVAPKAGTAHLVEETTGRIVQSKFLKEGDVFDLSMGLDPVEFKEFFGIDMGDAQFSLYFLPSEFADE